MSTTYTTIGQALYDLVNGLTITGIYASGWGTKANYPLKAVTSYPAFSVTPALDAEDDMDTISDLATVTYWVILYDSFENAATSEAKLRALVDLVRTELRKQKRSSTPLGGAAITLGTLTGEWGADVEEGLRFYRLSVTAKVDESLI